MEITKPQQLGSSLKRYLKEKYGLKVRTRYIKTVRGLLYSWYEISVPYESEQIIPNELRQKVMEVAMPERIEGVRDWNDISYGTIQSNRISIYGKDWIKFLKEVGHISE